MPPLTTRMMAARTDYAARPGQNADRLVPVHRTLPAIVPVRETAPTRNPHSLSPEAPRVVHVRLSYACRRPKPFDNSAVETFFKSLKAEMIWRQSWPTRRQAEAAIFQYINGFYNSRRRHSYLGGISPIAFEAKVA